MKESKNKKTFDGKSGGSVGIGLALGIAIGLMMVWQWIISPCGCASV
mgnify:CR=1 FL=1